jgi:hypothetical protein
MHWAFDYAPISVGGWDEGGAGRDLVLATADDIDAAHVAGVLANVVPDVTVTPLFSGHPIFWTRIESSHPIDRDDLTGRLNASGASVRYLASASHGSQRLAPPLDHSRARPRQGTQWMTRPRTNGSEPHTPWRWFLRIEGANVNRLACGTGAGTRLAIIDNDARDLEKIGVDAEVPVSVGTIPRAASHAALLLGWAVGAARPDGSRFRGVAPDASPRFYCIPKSNDEIFSLPLAILRAVDDGADVVICATYVEGLMSPLLDDALQFSASLGRGGRGAAVVFPTGREMSSPADAIHSSLSLGMSEPASDPRVFCAGPSARDGAWFLWRDRHGKLRPFANRGPSVRWLAPGDDMASPFAVDDRPAHAESSGASAIAAGVLLLAIESNPELGLAELDALLCETSSLVDPERQGADVELADRRDLLPLGKDGDEHNAKHGYGRLNAAAACMAARDPVALVLVRMGEDEAALRYIEAVGRAGIRAPYGEDAARWAVRRALSDARITHGLAATVRAVRLLCRHPERASAQPPGHLIRHLALILRMLMESEPSLIVAQELGQLDRTLREMLDVGTAGAAEESILSAFESVFLGDQTHDAPAMISTSHTRQAPGTRPPPDHRSAAAPMLARADASGSRS